MKNLTSIHIIFMIILLSFIAMNASADPANNFHLKVKPSETDTAIQVNDDPSLIVYDKTAKQGNILLWLPGTGGYAAKGPKDFYQTAVSAGYRVIALSYIDVPAVAQVCIGRNLKEDPNCPSNFRTKRIYGKNVTSLIKDRPQDTIVYRLTKLLVYMNKQFPKAGWNYYLKNNKPDWSKIAVSGQSQGGGMAAFIAKHEKVARIISFSGGWDKAPDQQIAYWYSDPSATPADRWYGTYNAAEQMASTIAESYKAMKIPDAHIYKLDLPVKSAQQAHGNGIKNIAYKPIWLKLLGSGSES